MRSTNLSKRISLSRWSRVAALGPRLAIGLKHIGKESIWVAKWLIMSREHTNFTYNLTAVNRSYLVWFCSEVTGASYAECEALVDELDSDAGLRQRISEAAAMSPRSGITDRTAKYGRRLVWYVLVRLYKPNVVVETGTDFGLGSVVLGAALLRNGSGSLVTIDVNPLSGSLIAYFPELPIVQRVGSSLDILPSLEKIDLFLHDSNHDPEYEKAEITAALLNSNPGVVLMSDNAHDSTELASIARDRDWKFLFFAEKPESHWWPGDGVGIAIPRHSARHSGSSQ